MKDSVPPSPASVEVLIRPLERGEFVDVLVRADQGELTALLDRFDMAAEHQRVPIGQGRLLDLGRIVDLKPIEFGEDGRWELSVRTSAAEVLVG